jgi:hypothetical protein
MSGAPTSSARLTELLERPRGLTRLVDRLSRGRRVGRRGVLVGAAVAGSALVTDPKAYALRPVTAYATICGPANTASSGWSVFCATINGGKNSCPPGSFTAGWWKAAGSSWCGNGYRYIVDCNAQCTGCTSGCSDNLCDSRCWNCSCRSGSTATCDQRRVCCNSFRYGQCNTQVSCSGGVHCRVVSCVPPYQWERCSTTSFRSDSTAEHSSPYLPQWGPMERLYVSMGGHRSFLGASAGPIRSASDGRGRYVTYAGGRIWSTATTPAVALSSFVDMMYRGSGGASTLGYPTAAIVRGLPDGGWLHRFEKGGIVDSASTSTTAVHGPRWDLWSTAGRETGVLGYPVAPVENLPSGGWLQRFQKGCMVDGSATPRLLVLGVAWTAWSALGREGGVLGYPVGGRGRSTSGDGDQQFQNGGLWWRSGRPAYGVWGTSYAAWQREGGDGGPYGYPTGHSGRNADGSTTTVFEGGTLTR